MKKMMKRNAIVAGAALALALPAAAFAADGSGNTIVGGIVGDCVDCHTMHNSEQAQPVAVVGVGGTTLSSGPIQNLLRMDCIACHAQNTGNAIENMGGGSAIPQVYTSAPETAELAGGNFRWLSTDGQRKGHNVVDLFAGTAFDNADTFGAPPGKYRANTHGSKFSITGDFSEFTCAGSVGCHGTRSQLLTGETDDNGTVADTSDDTFSINVEHRKGIAAISGAHHKSYDGAKDGSTWAINTTTTPQAHSGQAVADGYRFIPGLTGYGNETDRWRNVDSASHNEYFGASGGLAVDSCDTCHVEGTADTGANGRMTFDSFLKVPNNSMSGFCTTCHGMFHSSGADSDLTGNGVSGAFLRHPSDFVIPDRDEYAAIGSWTPTAPVARPSLYTAASPTVTAGQDMVMCLSCHKAHGSSQDYMLRFDYTTMEAGTATTGLGTGCLYCHTEKGLPVTP